MEATGKEDILGSLEDNEESDDEEDEGQGESGEDEQQDSVEEEESGVEQDDEEEDGGRTIGISPLKRDAYIEPIKVFLYFHHYNLHSIHNQGIFILFIL